MEFILVSVETACTQTHYTEQTPTNACTASLIHELNRVPIVRQSALGSRYFFMVENQLSCGYFWATSKYAAWGFRTTRRLPVALNKIVSSSRGRDSDG